MASFMCDFNCPRLCISVGSNTPILPLGTIMNLYIFQVATGKLRRKMNQCNETSISTVTTAWPITSGITHCKWRTRHYISDPPFLSEHDTEAKLMNMQRIFSLYSETPDRALTSYPRQIHQLTALKWNIYVSVLFHPKQSLRLIHKPVWTPQEEAE